MVEKQCALSLFYNSLSLYSVFFFTHAHRRRMSATAASQSGGGGDGEEEDALASSPSPPPAVMARVRQVAGRNSFAAAGRT